MNLKTQAGNRTVGLFAYPWDIVDAGIPKFVDECVSLGVTELHATTCYHSGKFLLPRNRTRRVYFPEPGCIYFPAAPDAFRSSFMPPVSTMAASSWLEELGKAAADQQVSLAAWTVFFHNSSLGHRYPQLTLRNVFGDPYPFALCPSHEIVQNYAIDLCRSIEATGVFSSVDLESIGYLGFMHGYHHEVQAIPLGPLEKFLLSLCFCEACQVSAAKAGISLQGLQRTLLRVLEKKFTCDHAAAKDPQNSEQITTLLALMPDLQAMMALRCATVAGIVGRIREACPRLKWNGFTSSFVGSPSNIWMEGISFSSILPLLDRMVLLAYDSDPGAVKDDLLLCLSLMGNSGKVALASNLGLPATATLEDALGIVRFALEQSVDHFAFFSYGFLGEGRLKWVKELAESIHGE